VIPRPAQYLLRVDDLCPTMDRARWELVRRLIQETGIRPILAIVPDNHDCDLSVAPADGGFWAGMREMDAAGASIAMHGYRHRCTSRGRSILPLHRNSEFAGIGLETQRQWIRSGLEILRGNGLNPRLWVAPRHGFDANSLRALREEGLPCISDGFARRPFQKYGVTWIPQQLWSPREKQEGLWTICLHPGSIGSAYLNGLHEFIKRHAYQFTSLDRVLREFDLEKLGRWEGLRARLELWRVQVRHRRARNRGQSG
jgi:predicted deacetylase